MRTWLVNTNSKGENGNPNAYKYGLDKAKQQLFMIEPKRLMVFQKEILFYYITIKIE